MSQSPVQITTISRLARGQVVMCHHPRCGRRAIGAAYLQVGPDAACVQFSGAFCYDHLSIITGACGTPQHQITVDLLQDLHQMEAAS